MKSWRHLAVRAVAQLLPMTRAYVACVVLLAGAAACGGDAAPVPATTPAIERSYPTIVEGDPGLATHTIYRPADLDAVAGTLPIVAWGNGGCLNAGRAFRVFLEPLAAHGFLILSSGPPVPAAGTTTPQLLLDAITWAVAESARAGSKYAGKLDPGRVAVMGTSCGGLEAMAVSADPRVRSTVLWNSGIGVDGGVVVGEDALDRLHAPTAWITGGPSDFASPYAADDYARVSDRVPSLLGRFGDVGHFGLLLGSAEALDEMVRFATLWLDFTLNGNAAAGRELVGSPCGLCADPRWVVESKGFD